MGSLFLTARALTLGKMLRDRHGFERLVNRVKPARTAPVLVRSDG